MDPTMIFLLIMAVLIIFGLVKKVFKLALTAVILIAAYVVLSAVGILPGILG